MIIYTHSDDINIEEHLIIRQKYDRKGNVTYQIEVEIKPGEVNDEIIVRIRGKEEEVEQ